MTVLNLNNTDKLYYGATEVHKLYRGSELLYPKLSSDPYWNNVVLYLKGEDLLDSSSVPKTLTTYGNVTISNTQSKYGGSSIYFNGIEDYLEITNLDPSLLVNNNFTFECWCYLESIPSTYSVFFGNLPMVASSSIHFVCQSNGILMIENPITNSSGISTVSLNTWTHVALTKTDTDVYFSVNGQTIRKTVSLISWANNGNLRIGRNRRTDQYKGQYHGYMDSIRFTVGSARYTEDFNPETDTYLAY